MGTIALIAFTVVMIATVASAAVYRLLGYVDAFTLTSASLAVFAPLYPIVLAYLSFVHSETAKLIGHQALTRRQADRVGRAAFGIRDRALGGLVYVLICSLVTTGMAVAVHFDAGYSRLALASSIGCSAGTVLVFVWLIAKHREVGRFNHRLEQLKRSDDARKKTVEELRRDQLTAV